MGNTALASVVTTVGDFPSLWCMPEYSPLLVDAFVVTRPRPSPLEKDPTKGHFRVSISLLRTLSAREYKTSMTSMGVYETKRTKRYADRKYKWTEADVIEDLLTVMSPYFYTRSHTRSRKRRRCSTWGARDFKRRILIYSVGWYIEYDVGPKILMRHYTST